MTEQESWEKAAVETVLLRHYAKEEEGGAGGLR